MVQNFEVAINGLMIAVGVLFAAVAVGGFLFWKFHKLQKQGQREISDLGRRADDVHDYHQAMGRLMLEEQKSYLYAVALQIDSLIKKNELLAQHNLIADETGQYRNSQLLTLKGGLQQYADSLAVSQNKEVVKIAV